MSKNNDFKKVKELSYNFRVLYVEDEEKTRYATHELLQLFFKNIAVAVNGDEATKMLNKFKPDILITDIQMPKMNGIELIKYVKANYKDIPTIITTAFNDHDYILQSFDLGVTQYLIKPVKQESILNVIYKTAKMIDDETKALELEEYKTKEQIHYSTEHITEQILGSLKSPCIIFTGDQIRYSNDAFKNEIGDSTAFDKKPDFISSCKEFNEKDLSQNKVSISKPNGRKVFKVAKSNINIDEIAQVSQIYIFMNITLEEYQKVKIQSYTDALESFIIKTKYHRGKQINEPTKEHGHEEYKAENKLTINDEENEILRRSHTHKTSAEKYYQELDDEILSELQELDELDKDFMESIYMLKDDANIDGIKEMATQLQKYSHEISLLFEFKDLSYAIESLSELFYTIDESKLNEKNIKKILVILEGIRDDLATWRRVIFIEKSALDIHYLDSSLFSACLQIELILSDDVSEMDSEEEDFVLF